MLARVTLQSERTLKHAAVRMAARAYRHCSRFSAQPARGNAVKPGILRGCRDSVAGFGRQHGSIGFHGQVFQGLNGRFVHASCAQRDIEMFTRSVDNVAVIPAAIRHRSFQFLPIFG